MVSLPWAGKAEHPAGAPPNLRRRRGPRLRARKRKRAVIAVGYGGLRMFSTDGGRTWGKRVVLDPDGGDDRNLLRGAGYGDGVWVAVGWKIFTSEDGKTWTEIHDDVVPGSWYDCVNYKDGKFIVQRIRDGYSDHLVSTDRGKTWQKGTGSARCEGLAKGDAKPVFKTDAGSLSTGWRGKITLDDKTIYTDSCCHVRNFEQGFLPAD
ncbi:MAG: glycoside hydrolase [Myxococcales bacterium]|nr:glycoside hydrolase [Myxococcales bacterium]